MINARIVPGVAVRDAGGRRDVMRGEETQILGAQPGSGRRLIVLPGTHCKWVLIEDGRIQDFVTFMTGEMYGALRRHTILARLMPDSDEAAEVEAAQRSFAAGVSASLNGEPRLMQSLFSILARGLFDDLAPELAPAYLSGLLIGAFGLVVPLASEKSTDVCHDDHSDFAACNIAQHLHESWTLFHPELAR